MKKTCVLFIAALMAGSFVNADILAIWENDHLAGSEVSSSAGEAPSGGSIHADVASAILTRGNASSNYQDVFAMRAGDEATLAAAISADRYIAFTLTADPGSYFDSFEDVFVRLEANNISMGRQVAFFSSATGFTDGDELWSLDLYDGGSGPGQFSTHTIDLTGVTALQNNASLSSVEFRIYNWGSSGAANALGIGRGFQTNGSDDLVVQGTVIPEPSTFVLVGLALGSLVFLRRRR
jgi:hypothetical protein